MKAKLCPGVFAPCTQPTPRHRPHPHHPQKTKKGSNHVALQPRQPARRALGEHRHLPVWQRRQRRRQRRQRRLPGQHLQQRPRRRRRHDVGHAGARRRLQGRLGRRLVQQGDHAQGERRRAVCRRHVDARRQVQGHDGDGDAGEDVPILAGHGHPEAGGHPQEGLLHPARRGAAQRRLCQRLPGQHLPGQPKRQQQRPVRQPPDLVREVFLFVFLFCV